LQSQGGELSKSQIQEAEKELIEEAEKINATITVINEREEELNLKFQELVDQENGLKDAEM
jgi:hypothetical protein